MLRRTPLKQGRGKAPTATPPAHVLRELLRYEPETGKLFWRVKRGQAFLPGSEALTSVTARGYRRGGVMGKNYMAHRIIWKMVHGIEAEEIDHIDGDPSNNRLANLRSVNRQQNVRNVRRSKANRSGTTGVYARRGYWIATIRDGGRQFEIGYFRDKEAAVAARKAAERKFGYHPNHGRVSDA